MDNENAFERQLYSITTIIIGKYEINGKILSILMLMYMLLYNTHVLYMQQKNIKRKCKNYNSI